MKYRIPGSLQQGWPIQLSGPVYVPPPGPNQLVDGYPSPVVLEVMFDGGGIWGPDTNPRRTQLHVMRMNQQNIVPALFNGGGGIPGSFAGGSGHGPGGGCGCTCSGGGATGLGATLPGGVPGDLLQVSGSPANPTLGQTQFVRGRTW